MPGKRKLQEFGIVPPHQRDPHRVALTLTLRCPQWRVTGHPRAEPVRLHRVQVRCGCATPAGSPSTTSRPSDMSTSHAVFHPLAVESIEPVTDDSVRSRFAVPEDLRDDYAFSHGQHLTVRTELAGTTYAATTRTAHPRSSGVLRVA